MTSDLFPDCKHDSPRLAWMKKHDVHTLSTGIDDPDEDIEPWSAWQGDGDCISEYGRDPKYGFVTGATEEDAIVNLAKARGIPLWNEEQYAKEKTK